MSQDPIERLNAALTGRYHIDRKLGEGGMATVYLAGGHVVDQFIKSNRALHEAVAFGTEPVAGRRL